MVYMVIMSKIDGVLLRVLTSDILNAVLRHRIR